MLQLSDPVERLPGVGPSVARKLHVLGLYSLNDLIFYFPFRYDEYVAGSDGLGSLDEGSRTSVVGVLHAIENIYTRGGKKLTKALFLVDTRLVPVVWFNQPYLVKSLKPGVLLRLNGKVGTFGGVRSLISPERVKASEADIHVKPTSVATASDPIGVYSETSGLPSKRIRDLIEYTWSNLESFPDEYLPGEYIRSHDLITIKEALRIMHFPHSVEETERARARFSYEEMLFSQLRSHLLRAKWQSQELPFSFSSLRTFDTSIVESTLPFVLTEAQKHAVDDILHDLVGRVPMNRLIEGDVGSGKTVVAAIAMYAVYTCGYKSILMAPTQILATQHFATLERILKPLGLKVRLVVSGSKHSAEPADIYVGTHALLHQKGVLEKVGLTIIDEQHRFGVSQRSVLRSKHGLTHVLSMTATPIPRTLALTLYGDLDLTVIDQMPAGRKPVKTRVVSIDKRGEAYDWIKSFIKEKKEQVFIVCPFVEPSESANSVKSAVSEFDRLRTEVFKDFRLGLLHGKMKAADKDAILDGFRNGNADILVCTPVVEVGIDIPNASIIIIESAERFGLAQLHQFRGRVGRAGQQAFCLLFPTEEKQEDSVRLKSLESTNSGLELAEIDLKYRGSGNLFGMQQSGRLLFKYADLFNSQLIQQAKRDAQEILNSSSDLALYPMLAKKVLVTFEEVEAN